MSIVVMKRKAQARFRSSQKFSITGESKTTNSSMRIKTRTRCCSDVIKERETLDTYTLSHSKYLEDKRGVCLRNQETDSSSFTYNKDNCNIVEYKNGKYGSSYESYDEYIRSIKNNCD